MDVELLRPGTVPMSKDTLLWFDFLLDPTRGGLIEKHLSKSNPDPPGSDLIIKFLTIQDAPKEAETSTLNGPLAENVLTASMKPRTPDDRTLKMSNKGLSLKILALKIFAFFNWDLEMVEQKLPLPLQLTLINDLLKLANVPSWTHLCIDYSTQPDHILFAVSLYHRWALRAIYASGQTNKQTRNMALHNPQDSQHVNEEILARLEEESEKTVKIMGLIVEAANSRGPSLLIPNSQAFVPLSEDDGDLNIDWSGASKKISINEFQCQLLFDVAVYQFFYESYTIAGQNFLTCRNRFVDWKAECEKSGASPVFCQVDEKVLEGYVSASRPLHLQAPSLTLLQQFLVSCRDNYTKLLDFLEEDNRRREIPQLYRDCLELEIAAGLSSGTLTATRDLLIRIQTLNVVRRVLDSTPTNYDFLSKLKQARKAEKILVWALQKTFDLPEEDLNKLRCFMNDLILACDETLAESICDEPKLQHLISNDLKCHVKGSTSLPVAMKGEGRGLDSLRSTLRERYNPQLEAFTLEWDILRTTDPLKLKELICAAVQTQQTRSSSSIFSRLDQTWDLPQSLHSALMNLGPSFLQQFLYISLAKVKQLEREKEFRDARELLNAVSEEMNCGISAFHLRQLINWEMLFLNIKQFHSQWPSLDINRRELHSHCIMIVQSTNSNENNAHLEIIEAAAITLLNLADWEALTSRAFIDPSSPSCQLITAMAFACQDMIKFKGNKKVTRDAWDLVVPAFLNQGSSGKRGNIANLAHGQTSSNSNGVTLSVVTQVLADLRDVTALTIAISLLSRIHNLLRDDQYGLELDADHTGMWPGVMNNRNSYNIKIVTEVLSQTLTQAISFYPTSVTLLKLFGDLYYVMQHYASCLKYYLMAAVHNTDYFTKPLTLEENVFRRMTRCCTHLQCFAQAGILCQFTEDVEYNLAYKYLSEQVSWDAMDSYYNCIWDINILEYLVHLHHKRGEAHRKQKAVKVIGLLELNANNNEEIRREAANIRKARFMRQMVAQYVGLCALANTKQSGRSASDDN
ncbi:integrator complex subunit 8 [Nilaparvata lugens]|uniref:integrator complex subunit 8 n=1 Tax=Nilaparvata lugens TaxID=108931 RepID=UPI000B9906F5|nr:integrator complex subunit 8 [Nilaparvata lugens]